LSFGSAAEAAWEAGQKGHLAMNDTEAENHSYWLGFL